MPHLKRDGIMWPVLACAQESFFVSKGARPVAAASKFDPFAKKARQQLEHCQGRQAARCSRRRQ